MELRHIGMFIQCCGSDFETMARQWLFSRENISRFFRFAANCGLYAKKNVFINREKISTA